MRFWLSDPHNFLLSGLRRESFLIGPQSVASKSNCCPRSAKLHRVCVEREASATLHPEEPNPVQVVGLRNVACLRVHRLRRHHAQHALPSHEVLSTAQGKISLDILTSGRYKMTRKLKVEDVPIFQLYTTFLDSLNIIFTVFFTLEFVLKFGAFRFKVGSSFQPHRI